MQIKEEREEELEKLLEKLKDENWIVRQHAVRALGNTGDTRAVEPLIKVLEDKNEYWIVRQEVAEALGKIGSPVIDPLVRSLMTNAPYDDTVFFFKAAVAVLQSLSPPAEQLAPLKPLLLSIILTGSDQEAGKSAKNLLVV